MEILEADTTQYSGIIKIFKEVKLGLSENASPLSSVLTSRGNYTLFVPTNEALKAFIHDKLEVNSIDELTDEQKKQFAALDGLYRDWNAKINVISRKDIDNLYEHHVLHSLAIAKAINFRPGSEILDFGCGGGFPGIPLAILFPECKFKLIDGTGKKIKVCNEVAGAIGLKNLVAEHLRGEDEKGKYDFVVSRAVMQLPDLMKIIKKNFKKAGQNALPNGLLCLKGGNLKEELKQYYKISEITPLSTFFDEEWFSQDKQLVYVPA